MILFPVFLFDRRQLLLDGAFDILIVCFAYPCLLCCKILRFFFFQSMTFIIPCSYKTLGITLKFNACQIGQLHLMLSKCCPALSEAWAPANAGAHAEPLYYIVNQACPQAYINMPPFLGARHDNVRPKRAS